MENLKKQSVRGYLLLESLISLVLLTFLTSVVLKEVVNAKQNLVIENQQLEALNVARMATESDLTELSNDGITIKIEKDSKTVIVKEQGKEILQFEVEN